MSESLSTAGPAVQATQKRRIAVKDSQRKALRDWYHDDSNGKQSLKSCSRRWQEKYGYLLNRATCSKILSSQYAHLDEASSIVTGKDSARESTYH